MSIRFDKCSSERLDGETVDGGLLSIELFGFVVEIWIMR